MEINELRPGMVIYSMPVMRNLESVNYQGLIVSVDGELYTIPVTVSEKSDENLYGIVWRQMYKLQGKEYYTTWRSALIAARDKIATTLDNAQQQYNHIQDAIRLEPEE